jgi:rare lipoprotein A (peptidoglycan hydrolase)
MNYRKIAFIALLAVLSVASLTADTVWEGTAAMSRYGEFPVKGLYGASNSFTANTVVTVENSVNKKSTEIIIVDNLSDKNLFLLLSKDASEKLGIRQDEVITVKVKILKKMETPGWKRLLSGKDPDNNPPVSGSALLSERIKLAEKAEAEEVKEEMAEDDSLSKTVIAAEPENPETADLGIAKEAESGDSVPSESEPAVNDTAEITGGEEGNCYSATPPRKCFCLCRARRL